jgi:hypothetical protein
LTENEYEEKGKNVLIYTNQTSPSGENEYLEIPKSHDIDTSKWGMSGRKGKWIFEYVRKVEYIDERLEAFYLPEPLSVIKIPDAYTRLVLYTDCMTDTGTAAGWPP